MILGARAEPEPVQSSEKTSSSHSEDEPTTSTADTRHRHCSVIIKNLKKRAKAAENEVRQLKILINQMLERSEPRETTPTRQTTPEITEETPKTKLIGHMRTELRRMRSNQARQVF